MKFSRRTFSLILCCFIFFRSGAQSIDISILKPIYKNETKFKNNFSSAEANSVTYFNIAAPAGLFIAGLAKHDNKLKVDAAYSAGAILLNTIIVQSTKRIVNRSRPFVTYPDIIIKSRDGETGGYSFPSGHTSSAFCTATSISLYFPKWYVIAPSYLWASAVGWARMYQGDHYPSDVLVGAIVGSGSAWLSYKIQKRMEKKKLAANSISF